MTTNCSKNLYTVSYTDKSKDDILVSKGELITDKADIAFVGKTKRDYGEILNENILHLLENFACPEDATNPGNPDLALAFGGLLGNPIEGQIWFNTTVDRSFRYNGVTWDALGTGCDVAGNYGVLAHGQQLPHPVCPITGYVFQYDECSWVVSPFSYDSDINYMECYTDENAIVTMRYRPVGGSMQTGMVNYQIVGIRGNVNSGTIGPHPSSPVAATPTPTPTIESTPTVTPTMTVTPGSSAPVTPTVTATVTPTQTATPSGTPAPGVSVTPTDTPAVTPTLTPASTPPSTPGPTQSPTPTFTPTVTPTGTAAVTVTPTATVTPTVTPTTSYDDSGDVSPGTYFCTRTDASACITLHSNGSLSSAGCSVNGDWLILPFRDGESGSDYTFTAVSIALEGPVAPSGPLSGDMGSNRTWCLPAPTADPEDPQNVGRVTITITGPQASEGDVVLNLTTYNTLPGSP